MDFLLSRFRSGRIPQSRGRLHGSGRLSYPASLRNLLLPCLWFIHAGCRYFRWGYADRGPGRGTRALEHRRGDHRWGNDQQDKCHYQELILMGSNEHENLVSWSYHANRLHRNGYIFLREWLPEWTTISIAQSIGTVIDIQAFAQSDIPIVQTLQPRIKSDNLKNQYSGTYGLNEFPLHTDLAHWEVPPRYILLRCLNGSQRAYTRLLDSLSLVSILDTRMLQRALVRARRPGRNRTICLLPLVFHIDGVSGFRWDSLFLIPMNNAAKGTSQVLNTQSRNLEKSLALARRGDTLIIDNWRVLHGRSKVLMTDTNRRIERVYLSETNT